MKRKRSTILIIALGVLVLLVILIWPAAPLWKKLGAEPICINGEWPHLKIVKCTPKTEVPSALISRPLPTLSTQGAIPIIFDDDGSPDGMIALLYFLRNPLFEVKAVTISCGEAHPEIFAPQVQQILASLGRDDIPVGIGRVTPLEGNNTFPDPWRQVSDDFWGIPIPETHIQRELFPAAELIVETLNNSTQPIMVFVIGNHTNLAEALRLDPGISDHIREIQIMGGSIHVPGNIKSDWPAIDNSVAEWNIWVDPIAADEVFASGIPIHLTPLDATNQINWTQTDARSWIDSGTPEGALAGHILQWMLDSWSTGSTFIWDLVAAVNATDPSLCPEIPVAVDIVTAHGPEQGQTVIIGQMPNTIICLDPDLMQVKGLVETVLGQ
ncbi:MAG: nucleoside hydrolase [Anaerolineaceae bacterium]|nr:nucleoside hydrolase [Anaerolineaceae bacterium]